MWRWGDEEMKNPTLSNVIFALFFTLMLASVTTQRTPAFSFYMNNRLLLISFILLHCINPLLAQQPIAAPVVRTDVCVFGATPSGIAAAVSAAREGAKVLLIEESEHLGGMITSGMSNPDFKTFEAVGGFYRQFMLRVLMHYEAQYGKESQQVKDCFRGVWYEPKVASAIFSQMLVEYKTN